MTPRPTGVRRQPSFPMPFPCKNMTSPGLGRSTVRPTNVHRLRPGDIDVVGAMGDSLVAGNGALEEFAMGTLIEYRGVSWAAGIPAAVAVYYVYRSWRLSSGGPIASVTRVVSFFAKIYNADFFFTTPRLQRVFVVIRPPVIALFETSKTVEPYFSR